VTSNRPPYIEASSTVPTGSDIEKPRARNLSADQSASAATKKTALSELPENLMEQIVDMQNVEKAWRKVKANKGAPGPDGITLDTFPESFRDEWPAIRQQLLDGTYAPQPARRKSISKDDGSERHLGIPNIMERLIQQCILQVLTPIFDPHFSESSFGFRPKRSAHGAIKQGQIHNDKKSCVRRTDGLEFLGYQFTGFGGQMRVSPKNLDKFRQRVRELTRRRVSISMTTRLKRLGYYLRGWTGYFCLVPIKSFFVVLDKWVRRRLRSCYWKQWRKPSARIRNLMKLGLARNEAVPFGSCSRGAWFMSHFESVQSVLTNAYLATTGLVSLSEVWSKLAPKR
jgi:hypothetical protein